MISIDSGKSVETSPGFGSQGVPRTFRSSLLSYRCSSGTRLTDCTTYVPISSMTMRSVVFTLTPTNTPRTTSTPTCAVCVSAEVNALAKTRHLNFPRFAFQSHVGCVTVLRFSFHGRVEDWNNAQPTRQATIFSDSKAVPDRCSKKSLECLSRVHAQTAPHARSLHYLGSRQWKEASGTTSPCQPFLTASQRATTLG